MKLNRQHKRGALSASQLAAVLTIAIALPLLLYGSAPSWWTQRGVLLENAAANDFAPANEGQLKNIAKAAVDEMDARLPGGAGAVLHQLVAPWSAPTAHTNDFAPLNLGQLKNVARPFYDRLIATGLAAQYPWTNAPNPSDDYSVANIGQVKNLFSFSLPAINPLYDSDHNGLPDAWERQYFGAIGVDLRADPDGDGSDNRQEYRDDTDPTKSDSVREPKIAILSGDGQQNLPGRFLAAPLVIRTLNYRGEARPNTPVLFTVLSGGGGLTTDRFSTPVTTELELISDANGLLHIDYQQSLDAGVTSQIAADVGGASGSVTFVALTVPVAPLTRQTFAAGQDHTLAVYSDGTVWSWGSNDRGELGDGTTDTRWFRAQVPKLSNIVSVSAFGQTSVALRSDGTVWTWGSNDGYALGNGSEGSDSLTPVQVMTGNAAPLQSVVAIASGYYHNLALRSDGTVWAWGSDWAFQLGNDSESDSPYAIPVLMGNGNPLKDVAQVACGDGHSIVVKRDGSVWAWGNNNNGEVLGTGISDWRSAVPAKVSNLTDIVMITAGERHNIALKKDGTVWTWGINGYGELGDGSTAPRRPYPSQLPHPDHIIAIATGHEHILALASDGNIWTWGNTQTAQATKECLPVTIRSPILAAHFQETVGIAAGYTPSFAFLADGSILGWRSNDYRQLGNPYIQAPVYARPVADFLLVDDVDHDGIATSRELEAGTDPNGYTTVGDGLSNTWKLFFGLSFTDPTLGQQDLTGKRMTVSQDYQLGTDPTKLSTVDDGIPDGWKVRYGISPPSCGVDTTDWIGKGMTIAMDYQAGTDPNKISTLGDNIPDAWKVAHKIDPLDPNALSRDDDNDGLTNLEEYQFHTDPTNPDTDGNGTIDGNENLVIITIVSDTTQRYFLDQAYVLVVAEAKTPQGVALSNIPVTITVTQGSGTLAVSPLLNAAPVSTLIVRTGGDGRATAYFMPTSPGTVSQATITAPRYGAVSGSNHVGGNVLNPKADDDSDGLTNDKELDLATDPTNPDTDGDGRLDGDDIWPTSKVLDGPRVPETRYVAIETGFERLVMNEAGQVAFIDPKRRSLVSGTFLRDNFLSDAAEQTIESVGLPPYNNDIRLRYEVPRPIDMNSQGEVLASVYGYYEWNPGVPGHTYPPGGGQGLTFFPNDPGHFWPHADYDHSVVWTNGSNYDIPRPYSSYYYPQPVNLNDAGAVLFNASAGYPFQEPGHHVLVLQDGYHDLGRGYGSKINNDGDVSGYKELTSGGVWRGGMFIPIAGPDSVGTNLNDAGQVIGWSERFNILHAWVWKDGDTLDLGPGDPSYINNKGQIAGNDGFLWQNGHVYNLNSRIGGDHPPIKTVEKITDNGIIVANSGKVILIPAELMVDANRDGEMSFTSPAIHDADQTSEINPYRFWLNDDDDGAAGDPGDHVPVSVPDYADGIIRSTRDLEDFTRLHVNVAGFEAALESETIKAAFEWRQTSNSPRIKLYRASSPDTDYLTSESRAASTTLFPFNTTLGEVVPGAPLFLPPAFWVSTSQISNVPKTLPIAWFLFEGSGEGKGQLVLSFWKDGRKIGETAGVWLDMKNIGKMYQRAKAQPEDIAAPYTVSHAFVGPVNYVADPNGNDFEKPWDETDQCVIFVHGWNVSYDEYRGVAQTMFKRLWHQGFRGHFVSFRWDTRKSDGMFDTGEYNRSENRAYVYAAALKQLAADLSNTYTVNLVAHSMGNVVCGEALRQGLQVRNYILMEAAIPMSCYSPDASRSPRLEDQDRNYPTPDYHRNPTTNESTLGYRGYISTVSGNLVNFYNQDDWALATGTTLGLETNWEKNQIDYKPDGGIPAAIHDGTWKYHYSAELPIQQRASIGSNASRYVIDSWEMKAFVARSRTKAVGAYPGGGSVGSNENLRDNFGFKDIRTDHSGQFTRNIQAVDPLYKRLREHIEE